MLKKIFTAVTLAAALNAHAAPVFNLFELGVAKGAESRYDQVAEHNIKTSIANEKGTLAMYSVKQKADPNLAYMVEIYADEAAYQVHAASPQYKAFLQAAPQILTDHKQKTALTPVFLADKKVTLTADTRTNLVIVDVKPEFAEAFKHIVVPEMAQSMKVEDGVLAMYAATAQDKPRRWYFFEIYAGDAAYQSHRRTPHFQDYLKQTENMLDGKESIAIAPSFLGNQGGLDFQ